MTPRKKRGLGFLISGAAFIILGVILTAGKQIPIAWPMIVELIGMVLEALGFRVVFPDID